MTRLYRSTTDRKLGGICGGLGEVLDADPTLLRLGAVLLALVTAIFPMVITYLIGWIIIPEGKPQNRPPQSQPPTA